MKTKLSEFDTYQELNEWFENPLIQHQLTLTKRNTTMDVATDFLREQLNYYIRRSNCDLINITWTKENGFQDFNIKYSEPDLT